MLFGDLEFACYASFLLLLAQLDAFGLGPCQPRIDTLNDHSALACTFEKLSARSSVFAMRP
jgi:hypothetical protein